MGHGINNDDDGDTFGGDNDNECKSLAGALNSIFCYPPISQGITQQTAELHKLVCKDFLVFALNLDASGAGQIDGDWSMGAESGHLDLVAAPRKVERVAISYAQASKQVHMRFSVCTVAYIIKCQIKVYKLQHWVASGHGSLSLCRWMCVLSRRHFGVRCRTRTLQNSSLQKSHSR